MSDTLAYPRLPHPSPRHPSLLLLLGSSLLLLHALVPAADARATAATCTSGLLSTDCSVCLPTPAGKDGTVKMECIGCNPGSGLRTATKPLGGKGRRRLSGERRRLPGPGSAEAACAPCLAGTYAPGWAAPGPDYTVGEGVECNYKGNGVWWPATIDKIASGIGFGKFEVVYPETTVGTTVYKTEVEKDVSLFGCAYY